MLTKEQVFTIPNALCFLRILIIPLIVWGFFFLDVWYSHYVTAGIILFSALLDVIDGKIARKFNMVTDFGKAIDPIADKLTQVTVATCLAIKYVLMRALVVLFVLKEIVMLIHLLTLLLVVVRQLRRPHTILMAQLHCLISQALQLVLLIA